MYDEIDVVDLKKLYEVDVLIIVATNIELEVSLSFLKPIIDDELVKIIYLNTTTIYFGIYGEYATAIVKSNSMGAIQRGGSIQTTEVIAILKPKT